MVVSGQIEIPQSDSTRTAKAVWVRVLDISRADASSQTVAEDRLRDVEIKAGDDVDTIPFFLNKVETQNLNADLTVSIHVNWTGSGNIEPGDFLTVRTYPVHPIRGLQDVSIKVRKV